MSDVAPAAAPAATPAPTPAPAVEQTPAPEPAPAPTPEPQPTNDTEGIIAEYWRAKLEEADANLEALRAQNEKLEREAAARTEAALEAARQRALTDHPELADKRIAERLRGETEEEIMADAKALAEWLAEYTAKAVQEARKGDSRRRPEPKLTPGHGGARREPLDTTAIAMAARRR